MKSNRRNLVAFLLFLALVGLASLFFWNPEPKYKGKKLSQWIDGFSYHYHMSDESPAFVEFSEAIQQIGAEATPFLLDWLRYQPAHTNAKALVAFWLGAAPNWLVPTRIRDWIDEEKRQTRASRAVIAFHVLGTNALSALPELSRLATNSPDRDVRRRAIEAMYEFGPAAIPTLLQIIANPEAEGRYQAMLPLSAYGTNALPAVPLLVKCIYDPADPDAYGASAVLGYMRLSPELAVPALTHALSHENPMVRAHAASSLAMFRQDALPALPALRVALADTNDYVRREVREALAELAPEFLNNAPPQ